jgi:predicted GNAT superfamily acetyltransferase
MKVSIRPLMSPDAGQVLSLNASARPNVAPLDGIELARLQGLSREHIVAVEGAEIRGYALVFAHDHAYDGEEFLALRSLIAQPFIYIDQVVVLRSAQGTGIGRLMYRTIERAALLDRADSLCCEVNAIPPNPGSLAFHSRLGFSAVGSLATRDGRTVHLLRKRLSIAA